MATETITLRLVAQDLMSGNVSKAVGKIDTLAKRGGIVGSIFQGVGQRFGQMLNPLSLATQGFGMLTDVMMDGVKAAIEDEKAQEQLNQTIRANVKGWDENTAAIEDAIKAGAQLAFTDDEVRAGLNQLIPRTKDIAEANRLNALAMDLARAKNLSLEESATLVGKAYSGQASALRRAGIAIKNTKNSTAALAELQGMVTGQADKYASTAEGSMAVLQITIDELVESLGYELLPYLKDFANYLRTDVIPRIDDVTEAFSRLGQAAQLSLSFIPTGNDNLSRFNHGLRGVSATIERTSVVVSGTWGTAMKEAADDLVPLTHSIEDVQRVVMGLPRTFTIAVTDMKSRIKEGKKGVIEEFRDLAWQTKHPFAQKSYANWLGEQADKATRKMKQAAKNGRPDIVDQYRQLRTDIMVELATLPQNIAALQRRINSILGTIYSQVATAVGNVFDLGGNGAGGIEIGGNNLMPSSAIGGGSSTGGGSGGAPIINITHIGSMSEADGQRFARTVGPHLRREMGRAG